MLNTSQELLPFQCHRNWMASATQEAALRLTSIECVSLSSTAYNPDVLYEGSQLDNSLLNCVHTRSSTQLLVFVAQFRNLKERINTIPFEIMYFQTTCPVSIVELVIFEISDSVSTGAANVLGVYSAHRQAHSKPQIRWP